MNIVWIVYLVFHLNCPVCHYETIKVDGVGAYLTITEAYDQAPMFVGERLKIVCINCGVVYTSIPSIIIQNDHAALNVISSTHIYTEEKRDRYILSRDNRRYK